MNDGEADASSHVMLDRRQDFSTVEGSPELRYNLSGSFIISPCISKLLLAGIPIDQTFNQPEEDDEVWFMVRICTLLLTTYLVCNRATS